MRTIHIGGTGSGCGKTRLITVLLPSLPGWAAIKTSVHEDDRHGPPDRITDPATLSLPGTDTARYLASGATGPVVWLRSRPDRVADDYRATLESLEGVPGVVIEGNAVGSKVRSGLRVLVVPVETTSIKPGSRDAAGSCDVLVVDGDRDRPPSTPVQTLIAAAGPSRAVRAAVGDPADSGRRTLVDRLITWARG